MKYCLAYDKYTKNIYKKADEVLIKINELPSLITESVEVDSFPRIIILTMGVDNLTKVIIEMRKAKEDFPSLDLAITYGYGGALKEEELVLLKDSGFPFFFQRRATDWETLHHLIRLGVSDIYIAEQLCFELKDVSNLLKEKGIAARTFPNVSQMKHPELGTIKSFFIRPNDVKLYENYFDVLEIVYGEPTAAPVLFRVYKEQQEWFGNLDEIITNLDLEMDNRSIHSSFAEARINCRRKCLSGNACQVCDRTLDLATNLKEKNMIIKKKEEK